MEERTPIMMVMQLMMQRGGVGLGGLGGSDGVLDTRLGPLESLIPRKLKERLLSVAVVCGQRIARWICKFVFESINCTYV
jgi:hypothetical protein